MCRLRKMLMLLSVHVTSVLFLVRFNNFALTMGFYWSYTLLLYSSFLCPHVGYHWLKSALTQRAKPPKGFTNNFDIIRTYTECALF